MGKDQLYNKLENSLSYFLIEENCKLDPMKRNSPEVYRLKGLNIEARDFGGSQSLAVRIGSLEAEFNISSGEKCSGGLPYEDERLIKIWINQPENNQQIQQVFKKKKTDFKFIQIIPFDLEEFYAENQ